LAGKQALPVKLHSNIPASVTQKVAKFVAIGSTLAQIMQKLEFLHNTVEL
jgi:hypothetical protein